MLLLLACTKAVPPEDPVDPIVPILPAVELKLDGHGSGCRKFSIDVTEDGSAGGVTVEDDIYSDDVDCRLRATYTLVPSDRITLHLGENGQSADPRLEPGVERVKAQQVTIIEPDGDWEIQVARKDRGKPDPKTGEHRYATYDVGDSVILVFEVFAVTERMVEPMPYMPELARTPQQYFSTHDYDYCTRNQGYFDNVEAYVAGTTTLDDRLFSNRQGLISDAQTWCSGTDGHVLALELRGIEREPVDVNFQLAGANRWVRIKLADTDTFAIVTVVVDLKYTR